MNTFEEVFILINTFTYSSNVVSYKMFGRWKDLKTKAQINLFENACITFSKMDLLNAVISYEHVIDIDDDDNAHEQP